MDDRALVRAALEGSQDAYRHIVVRYQNALFGLVVRMVRDRPLAEDLVQDAFVKAFRALPGYDQRRKLSSWLFKIAHNTTIDHLRRSRIPTASLDAVPEEEGRALGDRLEDESAPDPERQATARQLGRDLETAMASLDPLYRELVILRFREGLSYHEIAEVLDLPIGTVKTRLHRGRKRLAALLERRGWAPRESGETESNEPP